MVFRDNPLERMFIELDDAHKHDLVWKWEDQQIRRGARVNVDADYVALLVNRGEVVSVLPPGPHVLETGPHGVTGLLVDFLTNDRFNDLEIFFVATREQVNNTFGGPVDTIPAEDYVVSLRVFGSYSFKVFAPTIFITQFVGTGAFSSGTAEKVTGWISQQVLAAIREELPTLLVDRGIYHVGATQDEAEVLTREKANLTLAKYGVTITEFGELHLNIDEGDLQVLKTYASRKKMVELAGGYEEFARGEALLAAGQGGSGGDGGSGGMNMLLLSLLAQQSATAMAAQKGSPVEPPAPVHVETASASTSSDTEPHGSPCSQCSQTVSAEHKFCPHCGAKQACDRCGEPAGTGKFCPHCGTPRATTASNAGE